jgi:hypothetical protein
MKTIAESCKLLEELLEQGKVCRAQCSNLVQKFVGGITKMKETYFDPLIENETSMWLLYNSSKLMQLLSSKTFVNPWIRQKLGIYWIVTRNGIGLRLFYLFQWHL